jgi:hypothetical protein
MNFIVPFAIAIFYILIKILEIKFIEKESKPLKLIIRDTIFVFISSLFVVTVYDNYKTPIQEFMDVLTNTKTSIPLTHPEVFTDLPGF